MAFLLGARYEIDKRTRTTADARGTIVGTGTFDEKVFLPKAGLRYQINDLTTIGYTYSEGFRGGGLDADLTAPFAGAPYSAVAFSAERLKQHEIYGRTSLLNGALDLKASAFIYRWDDAQVSGAAVYPGSGDPAIGNVLEAKGQGIELSAAYRATDQLSFTANLGLLDTEITRTRATQAAFQGLELPRAPNKTASLGVAWQGANGFDASAQVRYVGQHFSALGQTELEAYTVVDVAAGYDWDMGTGKTLRIEAFVDNLFDERYQTFTEATSFGGLNKVGRPRTIGISATLRF